MKKFLTTIFLLLALYLILNYSENIIQYVMINFIYKDELKEKEPNKYFNKDDFSYVQLTDNQLPKNKQDILNIFYTALNKGYTDLTFYCPTDYNDCIEDVNEITSKDTTLSYINNFIKTFNTYNRIYVNINSFGRVNINVVKIYNDLDAKRIEEKVNELYPTIVKDNMSIEEKIKAVHDYIIGNTVYDKERADQIKREEALDEAHPSNTAVGPLFTGKAICGGYTDVMALFLDKMGVRNIKVASENHIWNAVYINGEWKHIDLTWDDPVVINGSDTIIHNYFLVSTKELLEKPDDQHNFDQNVFKELKAS